jgi:hypothetical protein
VHAIWQRVPVKLINVKLSKYMCVFSQTKQRIPILLLFFRCTGRVRLSQLGTQVTSGPIVPDLDA